MVIPSPRADAAEHRAMLLDAAFAIFQEHGTNAPLDMVVQRAGVGRATLYRNFADRDALMSTLLDQVLDEVQTKSDEYVNHETGLFELLQFICDSMPRYATLMDYVDSLKGANPRLLTVHARFACAIEPLMKIAIASQACVHDLVAADVVSVCSMIAAVYRGASPEERQGASQRAMQLLLHGIRRY